MKTTFGSILMMITVMHSVFGAICHETECDTARNCVFGENNIDLDSAKSCKDWRNEGKALGGSENALCSAVKVSDDGERKCFIGKGNANATNGRADCLGTKQETDAKWDKSFSKTDGICIGSGNEYCIGDMSKCACETACRLNSTCGAFQRGSTDDSESECCLFETGNTGNVVAADKACYTYTEWTVISTNTNTLCGPEERMVTDWNNLGEKDSLAMNSLAKCAQSCLAEADCKFASFRLNDNKNGEGYGHCTGFTSCTLADGNPNVFHVVEMNSGAARRNVEMNPDEPQDVQRSLELEF